MSPLSVDEDLLLEVIGRARHGYPRLPVRLSIKGRVKIDGECPGFRMDDVTIRLHRLSDSDFEKSTTPAESGAYQFVNLDYGLYVVSPHYSGECDGRWKTRRLGRFAVPWAYAGVWPNTLPVVDFTFLMYPSITFGGSPDLIDLGGSATLSWSTTNAPSLFIDQGLGSVQVPDGSLQVSPVRDTTYTLTASGPAGTRSADTTIEIKAPEIIVFRVDDDELMEGQCTTLHWSTRNATHVEIKIGNDPPLTDAPQGNLVVCPDSSGSISIRAIGPNGKETTSSLDIVVLERPRISLTADPSDILPGMDVELRWTATDATQVNINRGIGAVSASGSKIVSPTSTTTYTATATGPGGSATAQARVEVHDHVEEQANIILGDRKEIVDGGDVFYIFTIDDPAHFAGNWVAAFFYYNPIVSDVKNITQLPVIVGHEDSLLIQAVPAGGRTSTFDDLDFRAEWTTIYRKSDVDLDPSFTPQLGITWRIDV